MTNILEPEVGRCFQCRREGTQVCGGRCAGCLFEDLVRAQVERDRYRDIAEERMTVRREFADLLGTDDVPTALERLRRLCDIAEAYRREVCQCGSAAQDRPCKMSCPGSEVQP